jgi:hypothetical protein
MNRESQSLIQDSINFVFWQKILFLSIPTLFSKYALIKNLQKQMTDILPASSTNKTLQKLFFCF